jgi:mannose-6-phosphate isomerase-like protein (cupin superfamily)
MKIEVVNLEQKFNLFTEFWNPKIVGELNGQQVKLARFKDEFIMHQHEHEDEMFLVLDGTLLMEIGGETKEINAGEFIIIPKGTNHKPKAIGEVKVMLFEPKSTVNTGESISDRKLDQLDII